MNRLKVSAKVKDIEVDMSALDPRTIGGSLTDHSVEGTRVIHWMIKKNVVEVFSTDPKSSVEVGVIRVSSPEKVVVIHKVLPGEIFELPFHSKFGEGVLVFNYEK